jgi:hypothetical protein
MKTQFNKLNVGSKLSETQYYSVVKIKGNQVQLKNGLGQDIVVDKGYVEDCLTSADQYEKEEKLNRTDLAALFLKSSNIALTVSFNKKVKDADVIKEIMDAYEGSTPKTIEAAIKKAVKRGMNGEERVLVGYHTGIQDDFGRVSAIDMNIVKDPSATYNTALRLVDPRELNYLILSGTKYSAK